MKKNIYRSAAQVTAFSIIEKGLSFLYRIFLSRTIGADGVGVYQICLSVFSVFLTAASSGIPITVSRLIAKNSAVGKPQARHSVVTAGVLCTLLFTLPAAALLFLLKDVYSFLFPDKSYVHIFIILLPGLVLTSVYAVMRGSFWGNRQFLPYSVIELAENAVMVICGCLLIGFTGAAADGAEKATVAVLVSYIFSFAASIVCYLMTGGRFVSPRAHFRSLLTASLPVTAMRTSTSLLNSCVAMFLPSLLVSACGYSAEEAISLYGAALGMGVPILLIPNSLIGSIAVVVAPEMSENFYAGRSENLKRDVERTLKCAVFIATAIIPVAYTSGRDIGNFLYGNELSGEIIRSFSFMMLPMCISVITTTVLNSMHFEVRTLVYFFIGAVAMLGCIFALTPLMGINAYMAGLALSFIITAALNLQLLGKTCPRINCFGYAAASLTVCAAACVFGDLLNNLLKNILAPLARICVCGGAAGLFALAAFYGLEMVTSAPLKKLFARGKSKRA